MPIKYIPYSPEPVAGQALLNNFNRVLKYQGSNDLTPRLERGMPYYEAELKETVGKADSGNMVIRGDCLSTCAYLKDKGIKVDLVYIDPPFASGADYAKSIYLRQNPKSVNDSVRAIEELEFEDYKQFEDKMYGDIWDKEKYLNWMYENLMAIRSIMSENASIYVHLDWHIGHYVKIMMDEIFGEDSFRNEIIWTFGGKGLVNVKNNYVRNYNPIYFYTMNDDPIIHLKNGLVSESVIKRFGKYMNSENKILFGSLRASSDKIELEKATQAFISKNGRIPQDDDVARDFSEGSFIKDVWDDIPIVRQNESYSEYVNYSTQKPEKLLDRIISVSSNKGMIVADFFGGSGVTAAVADRLGRNFIHVDVGINSIQTTHDRLLSQNSSFDVFEINDGITLYRNPIQTMEKIRNSIIGLRPDSELDKFWIGTITTTIDGIVPVYIPDLMDSSSRIIDKVFMRRLIFEKIPELDSSINHVIIYYVDISDINEIKAYIEKNNEFPVTIELRDLKDLLDYFIVEDEMEYEYIENRSNLIGHAIRIDRFFSDAIKRRIDSFNMKCAQNDKKGTFKPITFSENGLELIEMVSLDYNNNDGPWKSDYELKIDITSKVIRNGEKTNEYWDGKIPCAQKPARIKVRNICGDETIFTVD